MDLVFRQSEAVAFVDLLGQSIPVAHTTAQFVLVLVVRTEADELPIHLTQGEANFVEFLIGNGNDMETLRVDLAAAHAVVHAGLAMVNLAGQPGIHVGPGTGQNAGALAFPQIAGDVACGAHDDVGHVGVANENNNVGVEF